MIDKKREDIRKKMRQIEIEKHFRFIREQTMKQRSLEPKLGTEEEHRLNNEVNRCLYELSELVKLKNYEDTVLRLEFLFKKINQHSRMSFLIFANCHYFCLTLELAIKNALDWKNQKEVEPSRSKTIEFDFVSQMLNLMAQMTYYEFDNDDFKRILNSFWDIIRENLSDLDDHESSRIFDLSLNIIFKMLQTQTETVFKALKEIGLGSCLTSIATSRYNALSSNGENCMAKIIEMYLYQQSMLFKSSEVCQINGIHIIGIQNNQKQILMAFCLSVLKSRKEQIYLHSINSLVIILKKYEYLGSTIDIQQIRGVLFEMIQNSNRKLKSKSLQLLDMMVYHGDRQSINQIMAGMTLVDILRKILLEQLKTNDEETKNIVEISSIIVCNLTQCSDKDIRKQYANHGIWDLAYENIYYGSPLLPLVTTFEYYFKMVGKRINFDIIQFYLAAVSTLDMQNTEKKIVATIQNTIRRLYQNCIDFWPEHLEDRLVAALKNNKLIHIIDEIMPQEAGDSPL